MLRQDKPKARLRPLLLLVETQPLLLQLEEATSPSISSKLLRKLGKVAGALVVPEQVQQELKPVLELEVLRLWVQAAWNFYVTIHNSNSCGKLCNSNLRCWSRFCSK
jgi:hypothetical protein